MITSEYIISSSRRVECYSKDENTSLLRQSRGGRPVSQSVYRYMRHKPGVVSVSFPQEYHCSAEQKRRGIGMTISTPRSFYAPETIRRRTTANQDTQFTAIRQSKEKIGCELEVC